MKLAEFCVNTVRLHGIETGDSEQARWFLFRLYVFQGVKQVSIFDKRSGSSLAQKALAPGTELASIECEILQRATLSTSPQFLSLSTSPQFLPNTPADQSQDPRLSRGRTH